jgi:hypothetical protein
MRSDGDIIEGFLQGDSSAFRELLERFRKACLDKIEIDHYRLWHERDEIVDAAETRLFEWRRKHLDGEPRFKPGERIQQLAWRVTKQECEAAEGYRGRQRIARSVERQLPRLVENAGDRVAYGELSETIASLPDDLSEILLVEAERVLNNGLPLEERFGISAAAARKRLERARRELKHRLWGRKDNDDGKA